MISIKKYLDSREESAEAPALGDSSLLASVMGDFGSLMLAFARAVMADGSSHGVSCGSKLLRLHRSVSQTKSPEAIHKAGNEIETHLEIWSRGVAVEAKAKNDQIKELIHALAAATESIGIRDKRNAADIRSLTENLETLGTVNDIRQIRVTLINHVAKLRMTVEQMQKESQALLEGLQNKVNDYESRLKSVENLVLTDGLTGIANRRGVEERMRTNITSDTPFCAALFDLNRFKFVNDSFGHMAGDDLLRQFAHKLSENSPGFDLVGRWGGDEFVLVLAGEEAHARRHVEHLRDLVCTRYALRDNFGQPRMLDVDSAVGIAEWRQGETIAEVISRADAEMYEDKKRLNSRFGHSRKPGCVTQESKVLA